MEEPEGFKNLSVPERTNDDDNSMLPNSFDFDEEFFIDESSNSISFEDDSEENVEISKLHEEKHTDEDSKKCLQANHPLMIKYQNELKERLLKLNQETDEQLLELKRTIAAQEKENKIFAERGYILQKDLKQIEDKILVIQLKYEDQVSKKETILATCSCSKKDLESIDESWKKEIKKNLGFQKLLEDLAFEVVQLSSLQMESFTDAKSLQRTVEKTAKEKEQLKIQKLRQDLMISRLENNKFNLEDKINFYRTHWGIKKEEACDLRKELNAASAEMEAIHFEKQQIVHQWKQSLASLEKQDLVLAEIRESVKLFEENSRTLSMDIMSFKKLVRKELERNEQLILLQQFRESDIARVRKDLNDILEHENDLAENITVLDKTVEITEQEFIIISNNTSVKEKYLHSKEKELQKTYTCQKNLEKKHMDMLHEKITVTKASKYTEKLITETRKSIRLSEEKGSQKENEREKVLLKLDNLKTFVKNMEKTFEEYLSERIERAKLLDKSEASALNMRQKIHSKRGEVRELDLRLKELISQAGGQELGPFERELANLRREITIAEHGKRNLEEEYLRCQQQLFSLNKHSSVKSEENEFYLKKIVVMEGKKIQLEADITKEGKDMKEILTRMQNISNDIVHINNVLQKRKELQETLIQTSELSKYDFLKSLKEAELRYLQKQNELKFLRRKKKKHFRKLIESQQFIVYWEGKIHLAEETRKILKSDSHFYDLHNLKSEIRRLQVKQEHIKKEQDKLIQEMKRAVYRHTSLYIEADKQSVFGKRKTTPDYVKKRIKDAQKKIQEDKKVLESTVQQIEYLKSAESIAQNELETADTIASKLVCEIKSYEHDTNNKGQEKQEAVIELSIKQKNTKLLQKVLDGNYVRAIRNERRRFEEIKKLQDGLRAIQIITQAVMNEYPDLIKNVGKIINYITVAKQIKEEL